MDETTINTLMQIANMLNTVEVKGKQNMMTLMGSIGTLEDLINKEVEKNKKDGIEISNQKSE